MEARVGAPADRNRCGLNGAPGRMAQALHTEHALAPFFDEVMIITI